MKRLALMSGVGALAALMGVAEPAHAAVITGTLGVAGSVVYDNLLVPVGGGTQCPGNPTCGLSVVDFADFGVTVPTGTGTSAVQIGSHTIFFANVDSNTTAQIFDLTNVPLGGVPPATGPAYAPAGVDLTTIYGPAGLQGELQAFSDADASAENLHFDMTSVINQGFTCTGSESEVAGTSCSEGPFVITRTVAGIHIDFDVLGFFRTGLQGCVGAACTNEGFYSGQFGTDFVGLTFAELFNRLDVTGEDIGCGGTDNDTTAGCTFSGTFKSAAVPEPATLTMFGLGSLFVARARRKKKA